MIENISDLDVGLHELLQTVLDLPGERIIKAGQGTPEPQGLDNYATYKPYVVRAIGHPSRDRTLVPAEDYNESLLGPDYQDFDETIITQADIMLSVNIMNTGARDIAGRVPNANFRWPVQEKLWSMGIAWRNTSEIRRMTGIMQAGVQSRYQLDINLYAALSVTDRVLRAAGFSYTVEDEAGNIIANGSA